MSNAMAQALLFKHQTERRQDVDLRITWNGPGWLGECVLNPLESLRLMCMDEVQECAINEKEAAALCGVDVGAFTNEVPALSFEDAERALGRLALMYLATLRNTWRTDGEVDDRLEKVALAPEAFRVMLADANKVNMQ